MENIKEKNIVSFPPTSGSNPYYSLFYGALKSNGINKVDNNKPLSSEWITKESDDIDIVHFHWLVNYYDNPSLKRTIINALTFIQKLFLIKKSGKQLFFTCHNLFPHSSRNRLIDWVVRVFILHLSDTVIVHSNVAQKKIKKYFLKRKNVCVIPHGNYIGAYQNVVPKDQARDNFNLDKKDKVFLFFGSLQEYKGITDLITAFKALNSDNAKLIIAGKASDRSYGETLEALCKDDSSILLENRLLDDHELQVYFNAADVAVLPFKKILTSGSLLLAYSFGCPVLIPDLPALREYSNPEVAFYINENLTSALEHTISTLESTNVNFEEQVQEYIKHFNWKEVVKPVIQFIKEN